MKCYRCRTEMKTGGALQNKATMGTPDFTEAIHWRVGQTFYLDLRLAVVVSVQKCPKCGHSVA